MFDDEYDAGYENFVCQSKAMKSAALFFFTLTFRSAFPFRRLLFCLTSQYAHSLSTQ